MQARDALDELLSMALPGAAVAPVSFTGADPVFPTPFLPLASAVDDVWESSRPEVLANALTAPPGETLYTSLKRPPVT
jgi:hypothetical protein